MLKLTEKELAYLILVEGPEAAKVSDKMNDDEHWELMRKNPGLYHAFQCVVRKQKKPQKRGRKEIKEVDMRRIACGLKVLLEGGSFSSQWKVHDDPNNLAKTWEIQSVSDWAWIEVLYSDRYRPIRRDFKLPNVIPKKKFLIALRKSECA